MGTGKSERALGNLWAKRMRAWGALVIKLPSSSLAGIPDWLVVHPSRGICLVEAKKLQDRGSAFVPSQCTRAQRFFLEAVARHGGHAWVLVLGPDSWWWKAVQQGCAVKRMTRAEFDALAERY